jgi:hypothetical protein
MAPSFLTAKAWRSAGKIYDYNNKPGKSYIPDYQHLMREPSWQIYRVYTHVGGFVDTTGEVQGDATTPPLRTSPGPEIVDAWKTAVNDKIGKLLQAPSIGIIDTRYLAECYGVPWTTAYHKPEAVDRVIRGIDDVVKAYAANENDVAMHGNDSWGGCYSPAGVAIYLLYPAMKDRMAEAVDFGGSLGSITRKEGWSKALRASVDFGRFHQRTISNQEVLCSSHIYEANRGLELVDPDNAITESEALRYLYEAAGLSPYLGNDAPGEGPIPVRGTCPYGPNWYMTTTKGTTKEPSFVGSDYGEMGPLLYEEGLLSGDRKLLDRALVMIRARD